VCVGRLTFPSVCSKRFTWRLRMSGSLRIDICFIAVCFVLHLCHMSRLVTFQPHASLKQPHVQTKDEQQPPYRHLLHCRLLCLAPVTHVNISHISHQSHVCLLKALHVETENERQPPYRHLLHCRLLCLAPVSHVPLVTTSVTVGLVYLAHASHVMKSNVSVTCLSAQSASHAE
jgi:hypothetical protein